ncbi:transmembrane protein 177 [Leptopilina heterotoma]|uniref:transmembrane protein 177 n=1 Tax=Leptopilina heterotoma TaxID=63436 RepID=UPI001CA7D3AA|nr:transmembrane protein 177 [Leptopilina heterotoma]
MSLMSRFLYWCKTPTGQKVGTGLCIGINFGVFYAVYLPQTFFIQKLKNLVQLNEMGKPVEVPEDLKILFNEVIGDLEFQEFERKVVEPFIVCRFRPFQAGVLHSTSGGIIGIPWHFTYNDILDVKIPKLSLFKMPVDVSRLETEDLAESLVLSRDAKKFAIAHELCLLRESECILNSVFASAFCFLSYSVSQVVKHKFHLYTKSLSLRLLLYTTSGFVGAALYFIQKDYYAKKLEKKIDAELAKLNNSYLQGGLEYYSKVMKTNIALRKLLDDYGDKTYDDKGDLVYLWRQKTTPYSERKLFFEMLANTEKA